VTSDEMQVLRDFRSDAPAPSEETIRKAYVYATRSDRASRRPTGMWKLRHALRPRAVYAVVALSLATAIAAGFAGYQLITPSAHNRDAASHGPSRSSSPSGSGLGVNDPAGTNPFGSDGRSVSMSQLSSAAASIPTPTSALANSGNVGSVWLSASGNSAALYYPASGIELMVVRGTLDTANAPSGTAQTINGFPALVYPGVPDASPAVPAEVMIDLGNNRVIELMGARPASDLVSVAQTLPIQSTP
jgi:hypothetical protein